MKRTLTGQSSSLPSQWAFRVKDVAIVSPPSGKGIRTLKMDLAFSRSDIDGVYDSCKVVFGKMADGTVTAESQRSNVPHGNQVADFIKYVAQSCGLAYSCMLGCEPPVDRFQVVVWDSAGKKAGNASIASKDLVDVIGGRITASDMKRAAQIYHFDLD